MHNEKYRAIAMTDVGQPVHSSVDTHVASTSAKPGVLDKLLVERRKLRAIALIALALEIIIFPLDARAASLCSDGYTVSHSVVTSVLRARHVPEIKRANAIQDAEDRLNGYVQSYTVDGLDPVADRVYALCDSATIFEYNLAKALVWTMQDRALQELPQTSLRDWRQLEGNVGTPPLTRKLYREMLERVHEAFLTTHMRIPADGTALFTRWQIR